MRHPIKILVQKSKPVGRDWQRFRIVDKILLTQNSNIRTENELCKYIYNKFGTGRYMLLAFQKGYKGFWNFWIGDIMSNGFIRDLHKNKEVEKLKRNYDGQNIEEYESDIQFEKEFFEMEKSIYRRGPINLIRRRPGQLHPYENELEISV